MTAIPFPPLNFIHIGKRCPRKIQRIIMSIITDSVLKINTGINPLKASQTSVSNPIFHPLILVILVAPMFLDPIYLGSILAIDSENNNPKGIDPTK